MDKRTIDRDTAMQLLGYLTAISDSKSDFSESAYKYVALLTKALLSVEITIDKEGELTMERILNNV